MKEISSTILILACSLSIAASFGGSEEKFIKKYAMMKIYESCFGSDVVKQIRREMKEACAKCSIFDSTIPAPPKEKPSIISHQQDVVTENANSLYQQQQPFDQEKLNQAILAYRPNPFGAQPYRPYSPVSGFYPFNNPMYQQPLFYTPYQQNGQFHPYNLPLLGQQYYDGNRIARNLVVKNRMETLTSRMSGKIKNVTCVMQELGYLDENLEPNYARISERIASLPISDDLRRDIQDGVQFCQQFSQCVPENKNDKSPLSRELIRPMFFFKCYKHKKLEACIMKDVREKYTDVADEEMDEDVDFRRQGKAMKSESDQINDLASDTFEFLYGNDSNLDLENLL